MPILAWPACYLHELVVCMRAKLSYSSFLFLFHIVNILISLTIRPCLVSNFFCKIDNVTLLFVFVEYCLIMG